MPVYNASEMSCWEPCPSCGRCESKGDSRGCPKQNTCSGRAGKSRIMQVPDPYDRDDYCRCAEGVLQYRVQSGPKRGLLVIRRFKSSPYGGSIKTDAISKDESDWMAYLDEQRERLNDEAWDPIQFEDGSSTSDRARRARG